MRAGAIHLVFGRYLYRGAYSDQSLTLSAYVRRCTFFSPRILLHRGGSLARAYGASRARIVGDSQGSTGYQDLLDERLP